MAHLPAPVRIYTLRFNDHLHLYWHEGRRRVASFFDFFRLTIDAFHERGNQRERRWSVQGLWDESRKAIIWVSEYGSEPVAVRILRERVYMLVMTQLLSVRI